MNDRYLLLTGATGLLGRSLVRDLAAAGSLEQKMIERFCTLARYSEGCGADAILFTCSAFGPAIEAARAAGYGIERIEPR